MESRKRYEFSASVIGLIRVPGYGNVKVLRMEGTGPNLVFLHGLTFYTDICAWLLNLLASHFNILAFDWPGSGDSAPHPRNLYTIDTMLTYADLVVEEVCPHFFKEGFVLLGHSLGGMLSVCWANRLLVRGVPLKHIFLCAPAGIKLHPDPLITILTTPLVRRLADVIMALFPNLGLKELIRTSRVNFDRMPAEYAEIVWPKFCESLLRNPRSEIRRMAVMARWPWEKQGPEYISLAKKEAKVTVILGGTDMTVDSKLTEQFLREHCSNFEIIVAEAWSHDFVTSNAPQVVDQVLSSMAMNGESS
ncbi:Alpha/beta hydrolase family protein [Giardia muris]|uniref:Alpha/beta hydrolase family protein n=1 Tax=Giardia muris TaxID=5742 RepID=A0A4Z1T1Z9_GIAMU|nr:Alpha/beta hydrolase family protein [Giardia muris]|eukprot:TNJ29688.1 Alpha/beta hydrolase family protein [Giardia muris]